MSATSLSGAEASRIIRAIQEISLARDLDSITQVVKRTARALTGADGVTFVLREEGHCFYVDEDAISPLWKGKRFPLDACISGWSMLHRDTVVIEDIYADSRIPHEAVGRLAGGVAHDFNNLLTVIMTYGEDAVIHHGVLEPDMAFVQKPLTPDALLGKVREVLGDR